MDFDGFLQVKLDERKNKDLYRSLVSYEDQVDFSSNDYLGLARSGVLNLPAYPGLSSGATGSRLVSGNSIEAVQAEAAVAHFHGTEAALIFNCGYMANMGLFSSIAGRGDTLVADAHIHASIIDGLQLSHASKLKFKHNDIDSLGQKLKRAKGNKFVAVESVYSMGGDEAPLEPIADLCLQHKAFLIVDEAHATGVWGENGQGLVGKYKLGNQIAASIHTFGKALGLHGAAVTCSSALKNYLVNFARPFIYSTALPPHTYLQIQHAYKLLPTVDRQPLKELIAYFRNSAKALNHLQFIDSKSQIQGIVIGDSVKAKALSQHLLTKGILAKAILSPTVPAGTERIRICLHAFNKVNQVDLLLSEINSFLT